MNNILWLDLETRSRNNIKCGHHKYAEESEILLMAWAIDDTDPQVYDLTMDWEIPSRLRDALCDDGVVIRTMGSFDRVIMRHHGYTFPIERHECVMALARSNSLPGGLDKLCDIFNIPEDQAKKKDGKALIQMFCIPDKKTGHYSEPIDHLQPWFRFAQYAKSDILAMREVYKRLSRHNYDIDRPAWIIYEQMNERGIMVDLQLATCAISAVGYELEKSKLTTAEITNESILSVTQTAALLEYIRGKTGKYVRDLQSKTVSDLLSVGGLDERIIQLLGLRQNISKSSTSKYKRVVECVCRDGRLRDTTTFNGALRTRRNTGAIFNPLNLPRPAIKGDELANGIELLRYGFGSLGRKTVMPLCSSALRGVIVADHGKKLVVSDWSNIEGRLAASIAGEEWKTKAFRDFDNGTGSDLYRLAFARIMSIDISEVDGGEKDGQDRQCGKTAELACQYGGSVAAFMVFAGKLDIPSLCKRIRIEDKLAWEKACLMWHRAVKNDKTLGLDRDTYAKIGYIVASWRFAHPSIVKMWYKLDDACKLAIQSNQAFRDRPHVDGRFLIVPLPSGQQLMYLDPSVDFTGISFTDGRFGRVRTYGSKIFENMIQSLNKDILCSVLPVVCRSGYSPILTVYDEIVCETTDTIEFNECDLSRIMTDTSIPALKWCKDIPLAAKGFEAYRYRKG